MTSFLLPGRLRSGSRFSMLGQIVVVAPMVSVFTSCLLGGSSDKEARAVFSTEAIRVDGVLNEEVWQLARPIDDFFQQDPDVNQPASERTEVRIALGPNALYLGVHCFDSDPSGIIARERRRDNRLGNDDRFEVVLDTFHDHRNAFYFVTNPLGTRFDALITDESSNINSEWNERWWAEARITEQGWTVEIEIPLTTLRAVRDQDTWGINFKRFIRRKNELAQWSGWQRDFTFVQVSQAGHLRGMAGVEAGLRGRIKPYALGGFRQATRETASTTEGIGEVGIEVAKYGITPSLVAEATVNPDFAQVEVDEAIVNLTRFPRFFPEKREFFLERAGVFEFSPEGRRGGSTERILKMYFPRRIGLTEDRREVPLLAGGKLTGRLGGFNLGLLNVQTDDFEDTPGSNYTLFRFKKNFLERSTVGTFFTNRQAAGDDFNRVLGADINLTFFRSMDIQGSIAQSATSGVDGAEGMGRVKFNWFTEKFELFADHLYIGEQFQNDIGFVSREGIQRSNGAFVWDPRPQILNIRRMAIKNEIIYLTDTDGRLLTREQQFQPAVHFHSGELFRFNVTNHFEQLEEDFDITPEVTIPEDSYSFLNYFLEFRTRPQNRLGATTRFGWGEFFGGTRSWVQTGPSLKLSSHVSAELDYEYNDVRLPQGDFTTHVVNSRFNVSFTNRWLTTSQVQYESESDRLVVFFRLRFIYRPGDDLFVVFNQTNNLGGIEQVDRALRIKFTHSFDF